MIINKTLRPSSRLKVKLMILVCTCIAGFTTSWYKLSFWIKMSPAYISQVSLSLCTSESCPDVIPPFQQKCQHILPLSYYSHNDSIHLYQSSDTRGLYFTLCWRSSDSSGNATVHMHLFITWRCIYISQEMSVSLFERWFPCGGSQGSERSREQRGSLGQYGSLGALLCHQLELKWLPAWHSPSLIDLAVREARGRLQLLAIIQD